MSDVLDEFLRECSDYEVQAMRQSADANYAYLTFNRWNVKILDGTVTIEDELDAGREESLPLDELLARFAGR